MAKIKKCVYCKKKLTGQKKKYCSKVCKVSYMKGYKKGKTTGKCLKCNKKLGTKDCKQGVVYCSQKCANEAKRVKRKLIKCGECKKEIIGNPLNLFCDSICFIKYRRAGKILLNMKIKPNGKSRTGVVDFWTEDMCAEIMEDLIFWQKANDANIFWKEYLYLERDDIPGGWVNDMTRKFGKSGSFYALIKRAKQIQEQRLLKWGSAGKLNPTITIFTLKNHHFYTDRVTNDDVKDDHNDSLRKRLLEMDD